MTCASPDQGYPFTGTDPVWMDCHTSDGTLLGRSLADASERTRLEPTQPRRFVKWRLLGDLEPGRRIRQRGPLFFRSIKGAATDHPWLEPGSYQNVRMMMARCWFGLPSNDENAAGRVRQDSISSSSNSMQCNAMASMLVQVRSTWHVVR